MPLNPGTRLGPYEIVAPIGAGGMGEVFKARDTRLDRIVAVKISQARFSERFEREARAVAAFNHPNICQVYDVGTSPEAPGYLVMEFIDGSPVAPVDGTRKLLDLAVQIADGLTAAHARSIVHRDLKPDNILVSRDGRVKILDFGLAKAAAAAASAADNTATMGTDAGTTVGTFSYMSPEQARGMDLTPQSDQFSFGLVLYELATGDRPFRRGSAPETMAAIIREEAAPLPAHVPAPLRWIIERLLAKDPSERYDSTRDLYRELKHIRDRLSESVSAVQAVPAAAMPRRKRLLVPVAAGIGCLIAGAVGAMLLLPQTTAGPNLANYKFTALTQGDTSEGDPQWSPDGKSIAYQARTHGLVQIFTRALGSDAAQLTRSELDCAFPFWSPDGATVYYLSGGNLWSVPAAGGVAQIVYPDLSAAALHPDGRTLAFVRERKIWIGSLKGSGVKEFWQGPLSTSAVSAGLSFSPDGSKLVALGMQAVWVLPYPSGTPRKLGGATDGRTPSWFPDSRHLALAQTIQLSVFDVSHRNPQTIVAAPTSVLECSVSPDGKRIAFSSGQPEWDVVEISIPTGAARTLISGGVATWADWAPSGTHLLFAVPAGEDPGIFDRPGGEEGFSRRLVEAHGVTEVHWSPDGKRFVFSPDGGEKLMLVNGLGGGSALLDSIQGGGLYGMSWSPDGEWISYLRPFNGKENLVKIRAAPGAQPQVLANAKIQARRESVALWSPAGDWIAYPAPDGIDLISPDGKSARSLTSRKFQAYCFSRDGSQLYGIFHNTAGPGAQWQLYSVSLNSAAERLLAPIDLPPSASLVVGSSLHPDGKRFLVSIAKFPYRIMMLEGFEPPREPAWLDGLLRRR
jgi:eukaryotic-like serine/threonine-protein kinase